MNVKKCQLCGKPNDKLTPRLAVGPRGMRTYSVCDACTARGYVAMQLSKGTEIKLNTPAMWAEKLNVSVELVKKEIKKQKENGQ